MRTSPVLHAERLTKRYGRRAALTDCDLRIPRGHVVGLVGPNGAGKSTLLQLACGLTRPTSGTLAVLGARPAADAAHLARVGFVAQDTPVYASFTVADHLRMGAWLNPSSWDAALARRRIAEVGLDPAQKAGRLSGGQRAQLALAIAAAKRPELLIFDEPAAALDPLARRAFMRGLVEFVSELGASAVLSSHLLGDVEQVCDYLVVLCDSRVQVAGPVRELLAAHQRVAADPAAMPAGVEVVWAEHGRAVVRTGDGVRDAARDATPDVARAVRDVARDAVRDVARGAVRDAPAASGRPADAEPVTLEELVLAYLSRAAAATATAATVTAAATAAATMAAPRTDAAGSR